MIIRLQKGGLVIGRPGSYGIQGPVQKGGNEKK